MIYGYLIASRDGEVIHFGFTRDKSLDKRSIDYLSKALATIIDFLHRLTGIYPEIIQGGDYRMSIATRENVIVVVMSDRTDYIAESLANKYADRLSRELATMRDQSKEYNIITPIILELENEIRELNQRLRNLEYIHK